ncbi:MAG: 2-hydroxyacyl-CoA dehydratase subunit D [Thermodesulfobacteriota bacterium]
MDNPTIINFIRQVAQNPYGHLQEWQAKTGDRLLGYFCINTPGELIHAAGFLPVRITGSEENISLASRHLPSYSCSLAQSTLEAALRGKLSFLAGTVFPHTCDSIQRLSDIWAINLSFPFHWDLILPVKLHTLSARTYLLQELQRFKKGLEEFSGRFIKDEDLKNSFLLFNRIRSLLRKLAIPQMAAGFSLSAKDLYAFLKASTIMNREEFLTLLKKFIASKEQEKYDKQAATPLFVLGGICDHFALFDLFNKCGAQIVGDDLCSGWRHISVDVSLRGHPLEALAEQLRQRPLCPCKYNPLFDRTAELLARIKTSSAKGVVFLLQKYCDPHAFEYPYLKDKLALENIPHLLLEIEPGAFSWAGLETRLQAFVEALEEF